MSARAGRQAPPASARPLRALRPALPPRAARRRRLEHVYLRGSNVRFLVLPEILKNAPVFKKVSDFAAAKAKPLSASRGPPAPHAHQTDDTADTADASQHLTSLWRAPTLEGREALRALASFWLEQSTMQQAMLSGPPLK